MRTSLTRSAWLPSARRESADGRTIEAGECVRRYAVLRTDPRGETDGPVLRTPDTQAMRAVAAIVIALALASPARAAEVYTVAGAGSDRLRDGALAGTVQIAAGGIDVAVDPRGGVAFTTDGTTWHVGRDGRLRRLGIDGYVERIAYAPDGALYAGTGDAVSRLGPDGPVVVVAGQVGTAGSSRHGGPAAAALLHSPEPLTFDPAGGLLLSD